MRERGLARKFEAAVERQAERARDQGADTGAGELVEGRRRDLRALPTLTIDPATARDFDDAISAERTADGRARVWVHIADVAAYVPSGSPLDLEAQHRGTSVYVPGAVEPMLPEALSNDACSLVPGADRAAVTVELELRGADVARAAFYRSLVRSDARLDYERVDRIFAGRERAEDPWAIPLSVAREAAGALARARARSGGLVLDSGEPEFVFDPAGNPSMILVREQTESHRLIEHLMIAANEAVARRLSEAAIPCLYRVHERPQPEQVLRLIEQLASLELPTPPLPDSLSFSQAEALMSELAEGVERHLMARSQGLARGRRRPPDRVAAPTAVSAPWGGRAALRTLILRALQQAHYSPKNIGHSGLHSAFYCHFTSPIRRYPDLVCHRALLSTLGAGETPPRGGELWALGEWTSEREREAMTIERDADDVARCFALEQALYRAGWERTFLGEVTGLISAGAFVSFGGRSASDELGASSDPAGHPGPLLPEDRAPGPLYEGMLPARRMRLESGSDRRPVGDWWELNELGTILRGEQTGATLRLGDPIAVRVERVDPSRGRVDLSAAPEGG
jgi:ribonuclease R